MATQGGAATAVVVQTGGRRAGGPSLPVAVLPAGSRAEGGPATAVYVVTSGPVQGGPAVPVVAAPAGARTTGGSAIPVYVVSGSFSGGSSFAPTDITGLQWWFKADILVLNDNDPVASWADSSGNGYTATQGTGANQPAYKTNILNGKPIVRFDGTTDKMTTASITHNIAVGDQFYAGVVKTPGVLAGYKAMCDMGTDSPAFFINGTKVDWYLAGDKLFAGNTLLINTWYTIIVRRFGGTLESYVNGVIDTTTFANNSNLANAAMTIGDEGGAGGSFWSGDMAELMMGKTLSNTDRDSLTSYFRTKYAHY